MTEAQLTLLPCPNPECRSSDLKQYSLNMHSGPSWWVTCEACKLCGPCVANDTEALRLWNALPREEPWVKIEPGCAMPVLVEVTLRELMALHAALRADSDSTAFDAALELWWQPATIEEVFALAISKKAEIEGGVDAAAAIIGHLGGKRGGPARARVLTPERRREIARAAAAARWGK